MKSNFIFLEKEFNELSALGALAEQYSFSDPITCVSKLGLIGEIIVKYILAFNKLENPEENTHANRIILLKRENLIPAEIDDILYLLRKERNTAVHSNTISTKNVITLVEFAYDLCAWFYKSYANNNVTFNMFTAPVQNNSEKKLLSEAEDKIKILETQLLQIKTAVDKKKNVNYYVAIKEKTEAQTRMLIDADLNKSGWEADTENLRYSKGTRPVKGRNIAIAEWPTDSTLVSKGFVDYALFIGEQLVGIIEAKKESENIASVIDVQGKDYAKNIKSEHSCYVKNTWGDFKVPFIFASNSKPYLKQIETKSGIWFLDTRNPSNIPYALRGWFSPENINEKLAQNIAEANENIIQSNDDYMTDKCGLNLRDYQIKAINKTTEAIIEGKKQILLAMATGTGKTRTILGIIYKMLETKRFNRILFLVDRVSLGEQANDTFKDVMLKELSTLDNIYEIKGLRDKGIDETTRVCIATVQSLVKKVILSEIPELTAGTFDLIIVDEAHRGYILDKELSELELLYRDENDYLSKYKQVIDYFDAVKIGLTATPALHTTEIFGKPIYTYSYREAVIDGWLVDHEPPYKINTLFNNAGIKFKQGEQLAIFDKVTNQVLNLESLPDELDFDVEDFNKSIIVPSNTKIVLEEIAKELDPTGRQKTLIFAVNDDHAEAIVNELKIIYKDYEVDNDAIMKITGKTAGGNKEKILKVIKQYKNNQFPNIAVTVDLLTTGIDIPPICNIVFMRKVNSRILFEQMMGRATRLCPEVGKTYFKIFDPVRVYEDMQAVSSMKPVAVTVTDTMEKLVNELLLFSDEAEKQNNIDKIIAKLQRKAKGLSKEQIEAIDNNFRTSIKEFISKIKGKSAETVIAICKDEFDFLAFVESLKNETRRGIFYTDRQDTLLEQTRGFGTTDKPTDYIESFTKFVKENMDKVAALNIICTKPSNLTRAMLRDIRLELEKQNFTEQNLNAAFSQVTNQTIVADIIAFVRKAALDIPVRSREDRIKLAFDKLIKNHNFNKIQLKLLEQISEYMKKESILNVETFEAPAFKEDGGFKRYNIRFDNNLIEIIKEVNTYLYEERGVA